MAEDIFYWKEIYFIEIAEIRYGWGFISLKKNKIKYGWDLFYWKSWDKVGLRINTLKRPK